MATSQSPIHEQPDKLDCLVSPTQFKIWYQTTSYRG